MKLVAHMSYPRSREEQKLLKHRQGCMSIFSLPTNGTWEECQCGKIAGKYVKNPDEDSEQKGTIYIYGDEAVLIDLDNPGMKEALDQFDHSQNVLSNIVDVSGDVAKNINKNYNTKFRAFIQLEPCPVIIRVTQEQYLSEQFQNDNDTKESE